MKKIIFFVPVLLTACGSDDLPKCDSQDVKDYIFSKIQKRYNESIQLTFSNIQEIQSNDEQRSCTAIMNFTSRGNTIPNNIGYDISKNEDGELEVSYRDLNN